MTPTSHCYFDYYQSDNPDEPLAIGGFLPLEKVYHFNPLPKELSEEEQQYVLGAQGNVWTEYMPTSTQVEYMAFPRAIALSEALWSSEGQKNYDEFLSKLEFFYKRLDKLNVNYANHLYDISGTLDDQYEQLYYSLYNEINDKEIRYTLDGSQPSQESDLYLKPFAVDKDLNIKAATFFEGEQLGGVFEEDLHYHKAVGKTINVNVDPHPAYNAGGLQAMINSINGSNLRFGDKEWLGFWGENLEIQIDLGALTEISEISTRFFNANGQWIYAPKTIQVFTSENDTDYTEAGTVILTDEQLIRNAVLKMKAKVRYIKITIPKYGIIPDGLQGAGNEAWTFIDEIQIR
ncbi:MAG: family 20 glycosylhydrolase, partial [Flavobacteriaceae bacterium]|nr:family 20 glycosylhydrolase [Flavobacteriaceae bacterium]